jgi:hypothetical protein
MKKSPPWTPTYEDPRFVSCIRLLGPAADNASLRFVAVVVAVVSVAHESCDPNRNPRRHNAGCNGYAQGLSDVADHRVERMPHRACRSGHLR